MSLRVVGETTIERIYREVTGRKMPLAIRKVLLPKIGKVTEQDVRGELDHFDCQLPYGEAPEFLPCEETVGLIKKPFKMKPKESMDWTALQPQGKDEQYSADSVWAIV
jgi:hypothetical protein